MYVCMYAYTYSYNTFHSFVSIKLRILLLQREHYIDQRWLPLNVHPITPHPPVLVDKTLKKSIHFLHQLHHPLLHPLKIHQLKNREKIIKI